MIILRCIFGKYNARRYVDFAGEQVLQEGFFDLPGRGRQAANRILHDRSLRHSRLCGSTIPRPKTTTSLRSDEPLVDIVHPMLPAAGDW